MSWIPRLNLWAEAWWQWMTHAGWQAAVVCLFVMALVALGRRWPAPLRYGLLLVTLLKFAAPPMLTLPTGIFSVAGPQVQVVMSPAEVPGRMQVVPNSHLVRALADPLDRDLAMAKLRRLPPVPDPLHWKVWLMLGHALGILMMLKWIIGQSMGLSTLKYSSLSIGEGEHYDALCCSAASFGVTELV